MSSIINNNYIEDWGEREPRPRTINERIVEEGRDVISIEGHSYIMITAQDYRNIGAESQLMEFPITTRTMNPIEDRHIIVNYRGVDYYYSEEAQRQYMMEEMERREAIMQQPLTSQESVPVGRGILDQINTESSSGNYIVHTGTQGYTAFQEALEEDMPRRIDPISAMEFTSEEHMESVHTREGTVGHIAEIDAYYVYDGETWVRQAETGSNRVERERNLEAQHGQPVIIELGTMPEGYEVGDLVDLYNSTGIIIAGNGGRPVIVPYRPEIDGLIGAKTKPMPKAVAEKQEEGFLDNIE